MFYLRGCYPYLGIPNETANPPLPSVSGGEQGPGQEGAAKEEKSPGKVICSHLVLWDSSFGELRELSSEEEARALEKVGLSNWPDLVMSCYQKYTNPNSPYNERFQELFEPFRECFVREASVLGEAEEDDVAFLDKTYPGWRNVSLDGFSRPEAIIATFFVAGVDAARRLGWLDESLHLTEEGEGKLKGREGEDGAMAVADLVYSAFYEWSYNRGEEWRTGKRGEKRPLPVVNLREKWRAMEEEEQLPGSCRTGPLGGRRRVSRGNALPEDVGGGAAAERHPRRVVMDEKSREEVRQSRLLVRTGEKRAVRAANILRLVEACLGKGGRQVEPPVAVLTAEEAVKGVGEEFPRWEKDVHTVLILGVLRELPLDL